MTPTPDIEENAGKNLVETINSLSAMVSDMKKVIEELISENKKLRLEFEHMKTEKRQTNVDNLNLITP